MIKTLLAIGRSLRSAWLFELAGAGLLVGGLYEIHGTGAALIGAGACALVKSAEYDAKSDG